MGQDWTTPGNLFVILLHLFNSENKKQINISIHFFKILISVAPKLIHCTSVILISQGVEDND